MKAICICSGLFSSASPLVKQMRRLMRSTANVEQVERVIVKAVEDSATRYAAKIPREMGHVTFTRLKHDTRKWLFVQLARNLSRRVQTMKFDNR